MSTNMGNKNVNRVFHEIKQNICSSLQESSNVDDHYTYSNFSNDDANLIIYSLAHRFNDLERRAHRISYNSLTRTLAVTMPSEIHEAGLAWLINEAIEWGGLGILPSTWGRDIRIMASPRFKNFLNAYAGSSKEPDGVIWKKGEPFPRLVLEAGWTETLQELQDDADLWRFGTTDDVKIVLILKFWKVQVLGVPRVKGLLKIYRAGGISEYIIFPRPVTAVRDPHITLREVFGNTVTEPGRHLKLRLEALREIATDMLDVMGLQAA